MIFRESQLAHVLLDGLSGLEIGGAAQNTFNIPGCMNCDLGLEQESFSRYQKDFCGKSMRVDITFDGKTLPLPSESVDFVIASHVFEHIWNPLEAMQEWLRVLHFPYPGDMSGYHGQPSPTRGGLLWLVIPNKYRLAADVVDSKMPDTSWEDLLNRSTTEPPEVYATTRMGHVSFWTGEYFLDNIVPKLCERFNVRLFVYEDADVKVGNGFTVVFQRVK